MISLLSKGLPRVLAPRLKASILRHSAFFMVQLSHLYKTTGKIRIVERVAISFSMGSSQTRDRTQVSCTVKTALAFISCMCTASRIISNEECRDPFTSVLNWFIALGMYNILHAWHSVLPEIYQGFAKLPINMLCFILLIFLVSLLCIIFRSF